MKMSSLVPVIFAALAVLSLALSYLDRRKHGFKATPARRTWLRIGVIFAAVSIYLFFVQRFVR
jgi:hypothetical protein